MKLIEVTAIGIRIFGILLFLKFLSGVTNWLATYGIGYVLGDNLETKLLVLLLNSIPFVLSLIFIALPVAIAKIILPVTSAASPELESDGRSIQYAGLTILGVYILSYAIPDLIYNILSIFVITRSKVDLGESQYSYVVNFVATVIELGIGVYLIIGVNGLVNIISKLRNRRSD